VVVCHDLAGDLPAADLIRIWRDRGRPPKAAHPTASRALYLRHVVLAVVGTGSLIWPLVAVGTLAAPVWLGFIFLLEPINARLGADTLWSGEDVTAF
jgi:hypothetical protein